MTAPTTLDGLLVQWGDRLVYPGNRIVRSPPAVRGVAGLPDRASAIRARLHATVVRGAPQVMVKATGGGRGMAAIAAHFRYIGRQGQLPIEDDRGVVHDGKEGVHDLVEQWRHGGARIAERSRKLAPSIVQYARHLPGVRYEPPDQAAQRELPTMERGRERTRDSARTTQAPTVQRRSTEIER